MVTEDCSSTLDMFSAFRTRKPLSFLFFSLHKRNGNRSDNKSYLIHSEHHNNRVRKVCQWALFS